MSLIKKAVVVLATMAAMLSTAATVTTATASAEPCGYFTENSLAYYNHCDSSTHVVVRVIFAYPWVPPREACFGPGVHYLGAAGYVVNAVYVGRLC